MIGALKDMFNRQRPVPRKGMPLTPESRPRTARPTENKPTYTKVFRWRLPDGQTEEPDSVEVVGSFNKWQRVSLMRDSKVDAWHATVHHIPGNKTHHYMLLVDGKPTFDPACDGLAPPHGYEEERYQLETDKGPRVFMLFAQTK